MKELIINQIIVPVMTMVIATILEIARRQLKTYLESKQDLIEKQKQLAIQQMGQAQYDADKDKAIEIVNAVEQLARNYNWEGAFKRSRAAEWIMKETKLTSTDIDIILEAAINGFNKNKK